MDALGCLLAVLFLRGSVLRASACHVQLAMLMRARQQLRLDCKMSRAWIGLHQSEDGPPCAVQAAAVSRPPSAWQEAHMQQFGVQGPLQSTRTCVSAGWAYAGPSLLHKVTETRTLVRHGRTAARAGLAGHIQTFLCRLQLWRDNVRTKWLAFNPTDKYTVAWVRNRASGATEMLMKGAPQVPHPAHGLP